MAKECELCGKGPATGNNRSFSNRATKRRFLPNLQSIKLEDKAGNNISMKICGKCRRSLTKTK